MTQRTRSSRTPALAAIEKLHQGDLRNSHHDVDGITKKGFTMDDIEERLAFLSELSPDQRDLLRIELLRSISKTLIGIRWCLFFLWMAAVVGLSHWWHR